MKLELKRLSIKNFKGFSDFEIEFDAKTKIAGANGTGKTTIQDAFLWLLFNKDSNGNAAGSDNFREKPLDENGNERHNLDTEVKAELNVDGKKLILCKIQSEVWTKPRGAETAVYGGNATKYYVDEVPVKLNEFNKVISEFADANIFRLLTTLGSFNAMNWKDRRSILVDMIDSNADEILANTKEYKGLFVSFDGKDADAIQMILKERIKTFKDELKQIPSRIDELTKLRIKESIDIEKANKIKDKLEKQLNATNEKIAVFNSNDEKNNIRNQITGLSNKLYEQKVRYDTEFLNKKNDITKEVEMAKKMLLGETSLYENYKFEIEGLNELIDEQNKLLEALRNEYKEVYESKNDLDYYVSSVCPTCLQEIPVEQVESARIEATNNFNDEKASKLKSINKKGIAGKELLTDYTEKLEKVTNELEKCQINIDKRKSELQQAENLYKNTQNVDYFETKEAVTIKHQISELEAKYANISVDNGINILLQEKNKLNDEIYAQVKLISQQENQIELVIRINELEIKEKTYGAEVSKNEKLLNLTEKYISERCNLLEDSINKKFVSLKWKLFDVQINGGISPSCNCLIPCGNSLVAYQSANTAAQVNADIEIINVLSNHYDLHVPLFVDNAERINEIGKTDSQMITMYVTEDKKLIINKEK